MSGIDVVTGELFAEKLSGQWDLVVLEQGTCTYRAGELLAQAAFEEPASLIEAPNFDQAVELAQQSGRLLLLPLLAHPHIGGLDCSPRWKQRTDLWFKYANPPLYLAESSLPTDPHAKGICATVQNVKNLVLGDDEIVGKIFTGTTQQAAQRCATGEVEFAITNEHGLQKYELNVRRELKKIDMSWFVYQWLGYSDFSSEDSFD